MPMGELLQPRLHTHSALLQLFTPQLSTPQLRQKAGFEIVSATTASHQRPCIADYLGNTPEPERSALLSELIAVDIAYRRQAGEDLKSEDYQHFFNSVDQLRAAATIDVRPVGSTPMGEA